jgi:Fur family transcriptional regulator, ferric uptake regulator
MIVSVSRVGDEHSHETPKGFDAFRGRGLRLTRQRQLIWDVLAAEPDTHLSAEDIADRVHGIDPSTVYRTLDLLVREGLVSRTDLGGDRAFYEPVREHPHHHVVCERCGAVTHVHDDALGNLRRRIEEASGYQLRRGELSFFGLCPRCRGSG